MDLTKQVNQILQAYVGEVETDVLKAELAVAKEAVKQLKEKSPRNPKSRGKNGKHYAADWTIDNRSRTHYARLILHNRQYQLTHLLENGHDIVRGGRKVGRSEAKPHIKPVEEWCKSEVERRIKEELK